MSSSFILAGPGVHVVTNADDGTVSVVAGLPITDVGGAAAQATETALFNDADTVYAPGIANSLQFLLPALVADDGAIYASNAVRVLQPTRINDLDSVFPAENVHRQQKPKQQKVQPGRVNDGDTVFMLKAELQDRTLRPALVAKRDRRRGDDLLGPAGLSAVRNRLARNPQETWRPTLVG